jgi:hypothetical protein
MKAFESDRAIALGHAARTRALLFGLDRRIASILRLASGTIG